MQSLRIKPGSCAAALTPSDQHLIAHFKIRAQNRRRLRVFGLIIALLISGCSTIQVKTVTTKQSLTSQRSSILTSSNLSSQTNAVLVSAGINSSECLKNLGNCVKTLSDARIQTPSNLHGALSEIYLAFALKYKASSLKQSNAPALINASRQRLLTFFRSTRLVNS